MPSVLEGLPKLKDGTPLAEPMPLVDTTPAADAWGKLADQAKAIGDSFIQQQASQAGDQAVSRDAQGNLQVRSVPVIGPMSAAYENAAKLRYLTESRVDFDNWAASAREQYPGDPNGFKAALDGKLRGTLTSAPSEFQPALRQMLEDSGAQTESELWSQKASRDTAAAQNSIDAALKSNEANIAPLVANTTFSNPLDDPAIKSRVSQSISLFDSKLHNPLLNYTQAQHDEDVNEFLMGVKAQAAERQSGQLYAQTGDREAAEKQYTSLISPLNLPFDEQNAYLTKGLQNIRELDTLSRVDREAQAQQVRSQADDAKAAALAGMTGGWRTQLNESDIWRNFPAPVAAQMVENLNEADQQGAMKKELALAAPSDLPGLAQKYAAPSGAPPLAPPQTPPLRSQAGINLANNNPGNMKVPGGTAFQRFPSMQAGFDAVGNQLNLYRQRGLDTISQIVSTYAPPVVKGKPENDTAAYIADVSKRTGIPANQPLSDDQVAAVRDAMITHEQGGVTPDQLLTGNAAESANIAAQWKLHNAYVDTMKQRQTQIDSDPAQFVLSAVPGLQQQLASSDPATRQSGVRSLLTWQAHIGVPSNKQTVFTSQQAESLAGTLLSGTPGDAVNTLRQTTAGMTAPQLQIAARQLAPKNRAFGMAVGAAQSDPAMAANLIIGERYLLENPDAKPDEKNATPTFDRATGASDGWFSSTGGLFQFAPDARATALASTDALYARSMIGRSAAFDKGRYQQAISQALGGNPVAVRGQYILPPRPGMSASDVETMLGKLDARAISSYGNGQPVVASGQPVSAADIAQHGVLTYTGTPGIYRVRFPGQGHLGVRGSTGSQSFMLNLGAMATGAPRPIPHAPSPQALISTTGQWSGAQ